MYLHHLLFRKHLNKKTSSYQDNRIWSLSNAHNVTVLRLQRKMKEKRVSCRLVLFKAYFSFLCKCVVSLIDHIQTCVHLQSFKNMNNYVDKNVWKNDSIKLSYKFFLQIKWVMRIFRGDGMWCVHNQTSSYASFMHVKRECM